MPSDYIDDFFFERIIIIVLLVILGKWFLGKIVRRALSHMEGMRKNDPSFKERAETLGDVLGATGNTIIYLIALFMFLDAFHINTAPILTGAGILGLAIGFGSQALVKDVVSGFFALIEDQYRVGEKVKIADLEGSVKKITMRLTVIAGENGEIHYIPNGTIAKVTNFSREKKG